MSKRILVVDDDKTTLVMMSEILLKKEYEVDVAINGVVALQKIKAQKPDLVITDVLMPEMDGFQLFKELKRNKETAQLLVLVQTGRKMMEDSFAAMGIKDFVSKPCKAEDLCAKIESMLSRTTLSEDTIILPKQEAAAPPKPGGAPVGTGLTQAQINLKVKQSVITVGVITLIAAVIVFAVVRAIIKANEGGAIATQMAGSVDVENSLDGEIREYDDERRLRALMFFDKGKLKWRKIYDEKGNLTKEEYF